MALLQRISAGLRDLVRKERAERELDAELSEFLESAVAAKVAAGLPRDAALRAARIEFGSVEAVKDRVRDVGWESMVTSAWRDVRYAIRTLRKSPGFAAVSILTLGLGIGATTAIYSVVDAILIQPLPFTDSDRLVRVVENVPSLVPGRRPVQTGVTYGEFLQWRAQLTTLTGAIWSTETPRMLRVGDQTTQLWGANVSPDAFTSLGARALWGRTLLAGDRTNPDVVVLGFDAWQRLFHSDPAAVGKTVELLRPAGRVMTIVGVMPPEFEYPTGPMDLYVPLNDANTRASGAMLARLAEGMSLQAAFDEANAIGAAIRPPRSSPNRLAGPRFEVQPLKERIVGSLRRALGVFLAAVGVVLLIVCANVANLLLARGTARQREMAVRLAVGASRARVVRQVLTESLVLATVGGALGALFAAAGIGLVRQLASVEAPGIFRFAFASSLLPRMNEVGVDLKMFSVSFAVAALTSVVFGILPAWQLSRTRPLQTMASSRSGSSRGTLRARSLLVVGQLVMATVLLVGAGLLTSSFVNLTRVERGYDPSNLLSLQILFPPGYPLARKIDTIEASLARLRATPSVEAAGFSRAGILVPEEIFVGVFVPPERTLDEMKADPIRPQLRSVGRGFLTASGFRWLEGREFDEDGDPGTPAIVISRTIARRYFGTTSAVGQPVAWHLGKEIFPMKVVGVVEDVRNESPERAASPEVFVEYKQLLTLLERIGDTPVQQEETALGRLSFAVRTRNDPVAAIPTISQEVRAVDPNVGIDSLIPIERLMASSVARPRFYMVMLAVFALVAAILAAIGVYGVLAYSVVQRTQEIGVRMALGAERGTVLGLVLRQGVVLTSTGIAVGLTGAAAGTRILQGMLFGVTPLDVKTFTAVTVMFGVVATLASYLPARRATKVDPISALRND